VSEAQRLDEDARRVRNWTRWGPYLSERQWGTVREDYSPDGNVWNYVPHDHARSRAYRWGEDGLLGICDRECRLCFALALWNGHDPILKERLFGLTGPEGNHGEDVKECYYYLDSTPTHSYMRALYKYPQQPYPYDNLVAENHRRTRLDPEYELIDTGVFNDNRYFDVTAEYAKSDPDDMLIRITVVNRGPDAATVHLLPTLWFRNTWSGGRQGREYPPKPTMTQAGPGHAHSEHETLGPYNWFAEGGPPLLWTDNESDLERLYGIPNHSTNVKDAFHAYLIQGNQNAVRAEPEGTKVAAHYILDIPPGGERMVRLRLTGGDVAPREPFGPEFDATFALRINEADDFYNERISPEATPEERQLARQGYAGLLWSKQFYNYVVSEWLDGDPAEPPPPQSRLHGRNSDWRHMHARDIILMPDKWEYPWFAAWDLAFHTVSLGHIDTTFARQQLILFLREWYMHMNGQIPAYEFAFGDVNPPVHAWACWRLYKMTGRTREDRDRRFLVRAFHKLLINFTWWVNRKDLEGKHLFSGGFLGLDNIGVFDRSRPLPTGGHLEQADGTAWMAFFCVTMLSMALELARQDPAYEDVASKFFEHFVAISDAINTFGGTGLWNDEDGFYYDQLSMDGSRQALRVRSLVGVIPLFACEVLTDALVQSLPGFKRRLEWFLENRPLQARLIVHADPASAGADGRHLLAIPSKERLLRVLRYVLDENEFLSPYGIRSLSRVHADHPFDFDAGGTRYRVDYEPGDSRSELFGGNSNWRGPVWFPLNHLLIEALERYDYFYGDTLTVECPTGSGHFVTLGEVAREIQRRLVSIFLPDANGRRPVHGDDPRYATDPAWRDLILFYEYFNGDTGKGLGASHQTGWTALAVRSVEDLARERAGERRGRYTPVRPSAAVPVIPTTHAP
jgi:hypothetical protein